MTLKKVMVIMKSTHNFFATERMYKARFKEWGVSKNMTAPRVEKLIQKAEQRQEYMQQQGRHRGLSDSAIILDVGDEIEVKRAQKYMKRNPTGLKKLRAGPQKSLEIIKALSTNSGKGRSGRTKGSILTAKVEKQAVSPPSSVRVSWTPETRLPDELPDDMTRLLQTFVEEEFHVTYPYTYPPMSYTSTPTTQWPPQGENQTQSLGPAMRPSYETVSGYDGVMLEFTLKLRLAHILLDDGLTTLAFHLVNMCLNTLSARLQQTSTDSRATTMVLLYALSAALEMAVNFNHLEVLHMLFQHINIVCAGQHPTMAEIARRMPQLGRSQQTAMLKLARQMISRASFGHAKSEDVGFELYSWTVDIAIGNSSAEEKLRALAALRGEADVQRCAFLTAWMDGRIGGAVCEAPLAAQQEGIWNANHNYAEAFATWKQRTQGKKIEATLSYIAGRIEYYKIAGDWAMAENMAREMAWLVEAGWGFDDAVARKFREDADGMRTAGIGHTVSLPHLQPLDMTGVGEASWDQAMQGESQGLPILWNVDENEMNGVGNLYNNCF